MQIHSQQQQHSIEAALAEFIAAAFTPAERQIANLKRLRDKASPRSHMRIIYEHRMRDIRIEQLRAGMDNSTFPPCPNRAVSGQVRRPA